MDLFQTDRILSEIYTDFIIKRLDDPSFDPWNFDQV